MNVYETHSGPGRNHKPTNYKTPIERVCFGNRQRREPPGITDSQISEAVRSVKNIPGWRATVMELMYMSEPQMQRLINRQIKNQDTRAEFIKHLKNIADGN